MFEKLSWPTYGEQAEALAARADEAAWAGDLDRATKLNTLAAAYRERGDEIEVPF